MFSLKPLCTLTFKYWLPASSNSNRGRDGDSEKVKQTKMGSGIPKGSEDRMVSHHSKLATWRIKEDQFRSKILYDDGPPSWPGHGQDPQQRHWTQVWQSVPQSWMPRSLLLCWHKETHAKCFPKNNEQDYFKSLLRYNFLELFLNHIRWKTNNFQLPLHLFLDRLPAYEQWSNRPVLTWETGLSHVLTRHLLIFS